VNQLQLIKTSAKINWEVAKLERVKQNMTILQSCIELQASVLATQLRLDLKFHRPNNIILLHDTKNRMYPNMALTATK
jgi:hypothetical protein